MCEERASAQLRPRQTNESDLCHTLIKALITVTLKDRRKSSTSPAEEGVLDGSLEGEHAAR